MILLELFSGSAILSETSKKYGFKPITVDFNPKLKPDYIIDLIQDHNKIIKILEGKEIVFMWASPNCKTYSVASIGTHWKGGKGAYIPKTKECINGLKMLDNTIHIIKALSNKNTKWAIENPRGVMRKVIDPIFSKYGFDRLNGKPYRRDTVTYCQYGDNRMKPTDIWHNIFNWKPRPMCKNGNNCHVSAPRGARTGTQGLKGNYERSVLPTELCNEVLNSVSQNVNNNAGGPDHGP